KPHAKQLLFHNSEARWRILNCGRRWGKTQCAIAEGLKLSFKVPSQRGWIVAPTYPLSQEDWRTLKEIVPGRLIKDELKAERKFVFLNNSEIEFKSADNEASLRGAGLNWVILDEAARIKEDSWNALRPALSDKQGRGIFISTPKGKNWFYRIYLKGKDGLNNKYESWHFPSNTNPYFPEEEWLEAKENYPADWFSQEYEALFLDDVAAVFRDVEGRIDGEFEKPQAGKKYFAGVDVAKYQDYTVIIVIDRSGHVCYFERFNRLNWDVQKARIASIFREYNAIGYIDSTGIGDPIYEDLSNQMPYQIYPFKFTNESKANIITGLQVAFEQKQITFPEIAVMIDELQAFEYEMLVSGKFRYSAPDGYHDDCVIGLALANWAKEHLFVEVSKTIW
ncbi:MAG TPA: hypothetical protein DCS12_12275, partial [Clostridiales bacterium]|nr:hypothetical protein [Clostridiales bacterium]